MLYSRSVQYAIRALALLANQPSQQFVPIPDIARAARVPLPFLAKIVQNLAHKGLVTSRKGPGGGIALARPPAAMTLAEIQRAVEGEDRVGRCVLGLPRCSDHNPCPMHDV
jgi:Rrf2 family protein